MPLEKDFGLFVATSIYIGDPTAEPSGMATVNFNQVGGGMSFQRTVPVSELSVLAGKTWRMKLIEEVG